MKEKGTLLVVGSLLALSLATVTTARAAGTLNFTGKIINESCQIANNGGDVNVDFGNVDMSALKSHEAKTAEFRARLEKGETLESLIPEAFAVVREASKLVFGMRHFDVQLLGGMVLNDRCIAEMRTGEGKTLTATLPAYLNALTGKGVHVVTVNDYLAQRDAENNRPLFEFLGMTVGINMSGLPAPAKREAYAADITCWAPPIRQTPWRVPCALTTLTASPRTAPTVPTL